MERGNLKQITWSAADDIPRVRMVVHPRFAVLVSLNIEVADREVKAAIKRRAELSAKDLPVPPV